MCYVLGADDFSAVVIIIIINFYYYLVIIIQELTHPPAVPGERV